MKNNISPEEIEYRYSNWVSMFVDMVKPKNLYLVGGRGTSKTEDIIAKRAIDIIYEMPRGTFGFISDTYVNAICNVIPAMLFGWERQKFLENYHYVTDQEPPNNWPKPFYRTTEFKHTISTFTGCKFVIKSLDRPSSTAGISTVHNFGDETKYHKEEKLKKTFPTLRGDFVLYRDCPYFMGQTFLTDMPNPANGEDDWILRMKDKMNIKQIFAIYSTALIVNELQWKLYLAEKEKASGKIIDRIAKQLEEWEQRLIKVRKNSTLFITVSSLANIDILTFEYIINQFNTLEYEEFKTAILSMKATLEVGARFYGKLSDKHFYKDGYNYDYYDRFGLRDNITQNSQGLRYCQHTKPLDCGLDVGNMLSLVIGQEESHIYRILKDMFVLSPDWFPQLGKQFRTFFSAHQNKVLYTWYDRAANAYSKQKRDYANEFKNCIEKDENGKPTGWKVVLMSVGQGNINHSEEYNLMNQMMGETNPKLPKLYIDKFECPHLSSSLKLAPLKKDSKGNIKKDKTSEKLSIKRLPFESTNMSDAFKYLMCRLKYLRLAKHRQASSSIGGIGLM